MPTQGVYLAFSSTSVICNSEEYIEVIKIYLNCDVPSSRGIADILFWCVIVQLFFTLISITEVGHFC